ncbi:hypothetical protein ENSA7_49130 [Enhygromyxa salina]|uniref:Uncharacterized protein n=1 Tax=Enhygromyxa salina TaxID=215803 RepID=A0A2S9YIT7_9BACT|nr:hypothetical protein ENSA7_49130 [Enhygromyxa salina]
MPASNRDRHLNVGFEAYRPVRPLADKVRGENLLWHSLLHAGQLDAWDDPLHAIQRRLGVDRSIWGVFVDLQTSELAWELRLLNDQPGAPLGVLDPLRAALRPWLELAPGLDALGPYAVLGLRFDPSTMATGRIEAIELHEREPGSPTTSVYRVTSTTRELVSSELLREPKRHINEVLPAIKTSEFVNFTAQPRLLGRVMIPELFACRRLHVAKRPTCDSLCFSGVNVEQLAFTYKRFDYPAPMLEFLTANQAALEHLLFDVAIEYREVEGRVTYPKTGYYGSF